MQLVKKIGRYQQLPILTIYTVQEQEGVRAFLISLRLLVWAILRAVFKLKLSRAAFRWPSPGYTATLQNGQRLHFTIEEKTEYEAEILKHHQVMQVMGICKALGHPGMR